MFVPPCLSNSFTKAIDMGRGTGAAMTVPFTKFLLLTQVISSVPQHQSYIDNNIVQGSLATSRWIDGGQEYSDSLNLTRASTDFGRCDLPLYEHWSGNAVVYTLQKADSPSLLLGRGTGAAMTVPFTKFLLLTQAVKDKGAPLDN
ncbi:hypothetical protein HPB47_004459 [Ixodes persulcatus]|uniref:Uncharacterized protein n=1 Tax=Ixodes persulcatus TaxID=34615 RepID=A0AC60PGT8_IXOPE|nr:hypothetical protein HPB47_004459 [Ixodes persulcatus]